ncbi:hypothetical protein [Furfurilactobacillus entadae]|uniref:hypothetical protein n=1 Tax=Furfurilactobacillus entadae TaxID=2922307 RepID=UPI0035F01115
MTKNVLVNGTETNLTLPNGFKVVSIDYEQRNQEQVKIIRYQENDKIQYDNAHVTLVFGSDERLISYNNVAVNNRNIDTLPSESEALKIASQTFKKIDPQYAAGLTFMRIDHLTRYFTNAQGNRIDIPIDWVKFAHTNGSYNWVSVGPDGVIIEFERESYWDYSDGRRATEAWNYDDWVKARRGEGPQLPAPQALA